MHIAFYMFRFFFSSPNWIWLMLSGHDMCVYVHNFLYNRKTYYHTRIGWEKKNGFQPALFHYVTINQQEKMCVWRKHLKLAISNLKLCLNRFSNWKRLLLRCFNSAAVFQSNKIGWRFNDAGQRNSFFCWKDELCRRTNKSKMNI